jgi:hypothetical protein
MKKNQLTIFKTPKFTKKMAVVQQSRMYKSDASLLGQLFISAQTRQEDVDDIFAHETQPFPPALSENGELYLGQKSALLHCIIERVREKESSDDDHDNVSEDDGDVSEDDDGCSAHSQFPTFFDAILFDGGHLIHQIRPKPNAATFQDFADTSFLPTIRRTLRHCSRVDIVWEQYFENSIKEGSRQHRGSGARQVVRPTGKLPPQNKWNDFLRDSHNKKELFNYLSSKKQDMSAIGEEKSIHITDGTSVIHVGSGSSMVDCYHEEADTRLIVHLLHALNAGSEVILIRTGDTDVISILCGQV